MKSEAFYDIMQISSISTNFEFGTACSLKKNSILELMPNKCWLPREKCCLATLWWRVGLHKYATKDKHWPCAFPPNFTPPEEVITIFHITTGLVNPCSLVSAGHLEPKRHKRKDAEASGGFQANETQRGCPFLPVSALFTKCVRPRWWPSSHEADWLLVDRSQPILGLFRR